MVALMGTMNISIPGDLRAELDAQVARRGYGTSSEYVRDLIRRDIERQRVRALLLEGREGPQGAPVTEKRLEALRTRAAQVARRA
jgi:antitoxin ParD1/3/4